MSVGIESIEEWVTLSDAPRRLASDEIGLPILLWLITIIINCNIISCIYKTIKSNLTIKCSLNMMLNDKFEIYPILDYPFIDKSK